MSNLPRLHTTLTALFWLCLSPNLTQAQALPKPVQQALIEAKIPASAMSTWVSEVNAKSNSAAPKSGKISVNAQVPMSPASIMKLVTSAAALDLFGPAQRWQTRAYVTAPIVNGILKGDLILQGGGDPKLVYENFWLFLRQLRQQGLQEIQGHLIIDRSLFQIAETKGDEFDGEPSHPYNVGPDALLLNFKSLQLRLVPDIAQVRIQSEPPLEGVEITPPQLGSGACGEWKDELTLVWKGPNLSIQGNYPASCGTQSWSIHPHGLSANQYAGALFRALWRELGGTFGGLVMDGKLTDILARSSPQLIGQWDSPSLTEILRDTNKFSNNVMARQLLLLLGTLGKRTENNERNNINNSTPQQGAEVIRQWLLEQKLDAKTLVLENGSGLSKLERISARELGKILLHAWHSPFMPELVAALPVAGYDGTMRRRLKQNNTAGQAHIKTGTLHDVRSIAGYVRARSGKIYVIVAIINHEHADQGQKVHDLLLQFIIENW